MEVCMNLRDPSYCMMIEILFMQGLRLWNKYLINNDHLYYLDLSQLCQVMEAFDSYSIQ